MRQVAACLITAKLYVRSILKINQVTFGLYKPIIKKHQILSMQFTKNGPELPSSLLQAHTEGRLIFFCGAGISVPAGLPNFRKLVEKLYEQLGMRIDSNFVEQKSFDNNQYDITLNLLEKRHLNGRKAVREKLINCLKPEKGGNKLDTHKALLKLARNNKNELRLVTTNYDWLFKRAGKELNYDFDKFKAPLLPVPKNSRWNGLVYLHGFLPKKHNDYIRLNNLVLTSADFGSAYITERWASRFVSDLFLNYQICFIGYGVEDVVLRYLVDALASDSLRGEHVPEHFVFSAYKSEEKEKTEKEWVAKGLTPVLYNNDEDNHKLLHETIKQWAEVYEEGSLGKQKIIIDAAPVEPKESTEEDDYIGRVLWALSDLSGKPAQTFAEHNPVPSLKWLDVFYQQRYNGMDLPIFDVETNPRIENKKFYFSLASRPASYTRNPLMSLLPRRNMCIEVSWDPIMDALGKWLTRHLSDPNLLLEFSNQSSKLHSRLKFYISDAIHKIVVLEQKDKQDELNDIQRFASNAIPSKRMRKYWRLLLDGHVKLSSSESSLYVSDLQDKFEIMGAIKSLRLDFCQKLAPKVQFSTCFNFSNQWSENLIKVDEVSYLQCDLVLASDDARNYFYEQKGRRSNLKQPWKAFLPKLINDIQNLLLDSIELYCEINECQNYSDQSYLYLPSISPDGQNHKHYEWVVLIELLRDAWLEVLKIDKKQASLIAQRWFEIPYPVFKRLALFAASRDQVINENVLLTWLISDRAIWLWSIETRREILRLFVLQGNNISDSGRDKILSLILSGPPRELYYADSTDEELKEICERAIWLRLAKLKSSGCQLNQDSIETLYSLENKYPNWQIKADQSDEFYAYHYSSEEANALFEEKIENIELTKDGIKNWLEKHIHVCNKHNAHLKREYNHISDEWTNACSMRPVLTYNGLCILSENENLDEKYRWPFLFWRDALYSWKKGAVARHLGDRIIELLIKMPDSMLGKLSFAVSDWIGFYIKSGGAEHIKIYSLFDRIIELESTSSTLETHKDWMTIAINRPIGNVTQSLLYLWSRSSLKDNQKLTENFLRYFTNFCNTDITAFRYARVLMATNLVTLYRVDKEWTRNNFLPLLNWENNSDEASVVWDGFLYSYRIHPNLMVDIKKYFLNAVNYLDYLSDSHRQSQYVSLLTYIAIENIEEYDYSDFISVFESLEINDLITVSDYIWRLVKGIEKSEQRDYFWENKLYPFVHELWPKDKEKNTGKTAFDFANTIILLGKKFPEALSEIEHLLCPLTDADLFLNDLNTTQEYNELFENYAAELLKLLGLVINEQSFGVSFKKNLDMCLKNIQNSGQDLQTGIVFNRLLGYT